MASAGEAVSVIVRVFCMVLRAWASDRPAPVESVRSALAAVRADAASVTDAEWVALLGADDDDLLALCALADAAREGGLQF